MPRAVANPVLCPHCGKESGRRNGIKGGKQTYKCSSCSRTFVASLIKTEPDPTDFAEDDINPEATLHTPPQAKRQQKAGPKKVLSATTQIVGDGLAVGVLLATSQPDSRKNLTMPEAQSIGHPIIRMLGRRVPGWLKPLLPKTKFSPEDAADLEEIAATLGKWGVRLVTIMVQDFVESREKAQAERQKAQATNAPPRPVQRSSGLPAGFDDLVMRESPDRANIASATGNISNGHNPAFDVLANIDLGAEV